jgi:hypothetical protein
MAKWKKLYERIQNNPKNVTFEELDKVLRLAGFERRQPRSGSSHYTYTKPGKYPITVPKDKPLKAVYVKLALEAMKGELPDD